MSLEKLSSYPPIAILNRSIQTLTPSSDHQIRLKKILNRYWKNFCDLEIVSEAKTNVKSWSFSFHKQMIQKLMDSLHLFQNVQAPKPVLNTSSFRVATVLGTLALGVFGFSRLSPWTQKPLTHHIWNQPLLEQPQALSEEIQAPLSSEFSKIMQSSFDVPITDAPPILDTIQKHIQKNIFEYPQSNSITLPEYNVADKAIRWLKPSEYMLWKAAAVFFVFLEIFAFKKYRDKTRDTHHGTIFTPAQSESPLAKTPKKKNPGSFKLPEALKNIDKFRKQVQDSFESPIVKIDDYSKLQQEEVLKIHRLNYEISEKLLLMPELNTFKNNVNFLKPWAELYVQTTALSMYITEALDLKFLVEIRKILSPTNFKKLIKHKRERLNDLREFIKYPKQFFSDKVPYAELIDNGKKYGTFRKKHLNYRLSKKKKELSLLKYIQDNVVYFFVYLRGALEDNYKPLPRIFESLEKKGFTKFRLELLMEKIVDFLKHNQFDQAVQAIKDAINKQVFTASSEECRAAILSKLSYFSDDAKLPSDDFPEAKDFSAKQWNQLAILENKEWKQIIAKRTMSEWGFLLNAKLNEQKLLLIQN